MRAYIFRLFGLIVLASSAALVPGDVMSGVAGAQQEAAAAKERIFHIRYIYLSTLGAPTKEEKAVLRERAEKALARIEAGEDFEKVAQEVSELGAQASERGKVVRVEESKLQPAIRTALLQMKPREVSDVIETPKGFYVVYLHSVVGAPQPPPPPPTKDAAAFSQKRIVVDSYSPVDFRPAASYTRYTVTDTGLWSSDKPAVFYAPVHVPDLADIYGFNVWILDLDPDSDASASLLRINYKERDPEKSVEVVASATTKGVSDPKRGSAPGFSECHRPALPEHVVNNSNEYYLLRVELNSGDDRQQIHSGVVVYHMDHPAGHSISKEIADYLRELRMKGGCCGEGSGEGMETKVERPSGASPENSGSAGETTVSGSASKASGSMGSCCEGSGSK